MQHLVHRAVYGKVLVAAVVGIGPGCDQSAGLSNGGESVVEPPPGESVLDETHLPLPEPQMPPATGLSNGGESVVEPPPSESVLETHLPLPEPQMPPATLSFDDEERASRGWDLTITELNQLYIVRAQGDADREFELAHRFSIGYLGIPQDDHEAARWFRSAAERGHVDAQVELGRRWLAGRGVPKNPAEAARWFRRAAEPKVPPVPRRDGEATGTPGSVVAIQLDHVAHGHPVAQFELGRLLATGAEGVDQDYREAAVWFRRAADQGHAVAQFELGRLYANGTGVDRDDDEAARWFQSSADQAGLELRQLAGPR